MTFTDIKNRLGAVRTSSYSRSTNVVHSQIKNTHSPSFLYHHIVCIDITSINSDFITVHIHNYKRLLPLSVLWISMQTDTDTSLNASSSSEPCLQKSQNNVDGGYNRIHYRYFGLLQLSEGTTVHTSTFLFCSYLHADLRFILPDWGHKSGRPPQFIWYNGATLWLTMIKTDLADFLWSLRRDKELSRHTWLLTVQFTTTQRNQYGCGNAWPNC